MKCVPFFTRNAYHIEQIYEADYKSYDRNFGIANSKKLVYYLRERLLQRHTHFPFQLRNDVIEFVIARRYDEPILRPKFVSDAIQKERDCFSDTPTYPFCFAMTDRAHHCEEAR